MDNIILSSGNQEGLFIFPENNKDNEQLLVEFVQSKFFHPFKLFMDDRIGVMILDVVESDTDEQLTDQLRGAIQEASSIVQTLQNLKSENE